MLRIRDPTDAHSVCDPAVRSLVEERFRQICDGEPYDYDTQGEMIVVELGDALTALEQQSGCPISSNPFNESRFPDPDFVPVCEVIEEHPGCYEMVFIFTDDGYGVSFYIPKSPGIDAELLALCAQFAEPSLT